MVAARFEAQLLELATRDPVLRKRCRKALERLMEAPERVGSHLEPVTGTAGTFTARVDRNYRLILQRHEDEAGAFYLIVAVASHDDAY